MTIQEFEKYNETQSMPKEDIGQGVGYKANIDWDTVNPKDIIYIPEYAYDSSDTVPRENAYSKEDFLEMAKGFLDDHAEQVAKMQKPPTVDGFAYDIFDTCDWQFPESLLIEWDGYGILNENG